MLYIYIYNNSLYIINISLLASDGRIIIYGGGKGIGILSSVKVVPDLAVLNTQTTPFEWTTPQVSSNIAEEVPSLITHTANLVGNFMIVAFGK